MKTKTKTKIQFILNLQTVQKKKIFNHIKNNWMKIIRLNLKIIKTSTNIKIIKSNQININRKT